MQPHHIIIGALTLIVTLLVIILCQIKALKPNLHPCRLSQETFYAIMDKFVGGQIRKRFSLLGGYEIAGSIKDLWVWKYNDEPGLKIKCSWTVDRDRKDWKPYASLSQEGNSNEYFNAFAEEAVCDLHLSEMFYVGKYGVCLILTNAEIIFLTYKDAPCNVTLDEVVDPEGLIQRDILAKTTYQKA